LSPIIWLNPRLCDRERCASDDFVIISYGRDGKKEDFKFNPSNPEAGLFEIDSVDDFDKDLVMWNGSWIRAPMPRG